MRLRLPATIKDIRAFLSSLDWETLIQQVEGEMRAQMAIVGPVNAGKSTLFNALKGAEISPVSAVPGTTRSLVREHLGPFLLVDTPGFDPAKAVTRAGIVSRGIETLDLVVLLLDGEAGPMWRSIASFRGPGAR